MVRNFKFAILWGLLFYPLISLAVYEHVTFDVNQIWPVIAATSAALLILRYGTLLARRSEQKGKELSEKLISKISEDLVDEEEEQPPSEETYLQMLMSLHFVGEYLTLAFALIGPLAGTAIFVEIFGFGDADINDFHIGMIIFVFSVCLYSWLKLIEHRALIIITLPIIPIRLVWLTPIGVVLGLYTAFA